jgi:predicted O-methyltransferase YrrM
VNAATKLLTLAARSLKIAAGNPRRLSHVLGTALAASEEVCDWEVDLLRFPQLTVADLLPPPATEYRTHLCLFPKTNASVSPLECVALALLMRRASARTAFEFGTYKGVSTSQLALNVAEGGQVFTLDLPEDPIETAYEISITKDSVIASEPGKGALLPADLRSRVTFLRQDSARFDPKPYAGQMDFVFVDGAHNADYVRNDSEKGWHMLRSGGIIAWHDCVVWDADVVRYLLRCPYRPARVVGTSLAFATKP